MNNSIDLKIYSPINIFLDEEVKKITFQGKEGSLTLLPNHVDYISSFENNLMSYTDLNGNLKFIALNNGILVKYANKVRLTAYKAIMADSISALKKEIDLVAENEVNIEKEINKNLKQLEYYMLNNIMNLK